MTMKQVAFVSLIAVAAASKMEQTNIFDVDGSDNPVNRFDINFQESETESSSTPTVSTARTGDTVTCKDGSETLISQEDVRWELQDINLSYLENASIEKACVTSSDNVEGTSCRFDFGLFPNNLDEVCEKYGGIYEEREHSIQCHNHATQEQLYYQIDRFPNCFPESCQHAEVDSMVEHQIESVRRALEEDSGMTCYADYDILRHAGENDSAGGADVSTSLVMSSIAGLALLLFYI